MVQLKTLKGMTLIELLATITIIGVLSVLALPSLRGVEARGAMTNAQRGVQAVLYRVQQLSLAPEKNTNPADITIGYGIAFLQKEASPLGTRVGGCRVQSNNDFLVTYKIVARTATGGQIVGVMNPFTPDSPCGIGAINAVKYPNDFYVLPPGISMNAAESFATSNPTTALPWMIITPLYSAGNTYGDIDPTSLGFNSPLPSGQSDAAGQLVMQHNSIVVSGYKFCKAVKFFRNSNGVNTTSTVLEGCR